MHFPQKLQHIADKYDMFLICNSPRNLITALKFTNSSGYWFMAQNMDNIDLQTFFYCNLTTMVSTEVKLWFLSSLEHFWPDPLDTLSKVATFFEKKHKVFKNKAQGYCTPLRPFMLSCYIFKGLKGYCTPKDLLRCNMITWKYHHLFFRHHVRVTIVFLRWKTKLEIEFEFEH